MDRSLEDRIADGQVCFASSLNLRGFLLPFSQSLHHTILAQDYIRIFEFQLINIISDSKTVGDEDMEVVAEGMMGRVMGFQRSDI
jgi:hypothetical protein